MTLYIPGIVTLITSYVPVVVASITNYIYMVAASIHLHSLDNKLHMIVVHSQSVHIFGSSLDHKFYILVLW